MHTLIHKGMAARYYSTVSEYIRFLVRRDQAPGAVSRAEPPIETPRTMNQVIEDAMRESDRENDLRGRW
jgi:Arc/MetJ-type ribon-helix-helix transcriptional regulator